MIAPVRASDTPFAVHAEHGQDDWWCACGQSKPPAFLRRLAQGRGMKNLVPQDHGVLGADVDVPSGRGFVALLESFRATGGTAPGEILARLLEEHQVGSAASLAKLIDTGQAFGFEWGHSLWIPMFQFAANDLALKAGAQQVRAELPPLWSGWHVATWFAAPNARLDGHSPADRLDADLDCVVQAAQWLESVDEFSVSLARRAREVAAHV
jgi:hypothetical protein